MLLIRYYITVLPQSHVVAHLFISGVVSAFFMCHNTKLFIQSEDISAHHRPKFHKYRGELFSPGLDLRIRPRAGRQRPLLYPR
jgi:hypothetical protein